MPVMDGYIASEQILKLVKPELGENPNFCTIMALTSYTSQDVEQRCLKIGMTRVIAKPLNAAVLKEVVDQYFFDDEIVIR
jgi:CheY-like chemotaxis protein